ncbi:MAG: fructosamine kinase family protein [Bacteroidota bacterium]|nr:fructosamine kinase family protein [Bacteroidota bacterium]
MIPQEIEDSLGSFFRLKSPEAENIVTTYSLSGGCINNVQRVDTNLRSYCIKYNSRTAFPKMFESEASGLKALAAAKEIRVPAVIHVDSTENYSYLLLEFIYQERRISGFMKDFGRSLARLHRHSAEYFGFSEDNYMGSLPQSNRHHSDWISFFIEERIEKQFAIAVDGGYFAPEDRRYFESIYREIPSMIPPEPPALLHGDLWGGNYMVSEEGKACLIDPAVYYGHREVDIAMTTLFGGFDPAFYAAYEEEYPLEYGWRDRLDILNLYPLLIHVNLFGSGYVGSVQNIIQRF